MSRFLAHSATAESPDGQELLQHLKNVSYLTGKFCASFEMKEEGELCGLLHDIGKYSAAFQKRIKGSKRKVDHSTAGAYELFAMRQVSAAVCVAGHHGGLPDLGNRNDLANTFMGRINQAKNGGVVDYSAWRKEINISHTTSRKEHTNMDYYYLVRMLFSSLTDADWLDTEAYYKNITYTVSKKDLNELKKKLDGYVAKWWDARETINICRCKILQAAINGGSEEPGFFSMAVPTGGGKTISSMAFALNHAISHKKDRIIYVIPYCSIIEQTQSVFETIFGKDMITAHYSGAVFQREEDTPDQDMKAFSADNWEAPIILTTAVQFFESLYAAKPGKSRKLHNIANSVIIFDEAQMLPVPYLEPCVAGIGQLVHHFGCTAVLCTATQPVLDPLLMKYATNQAVRELCPDRSLMYERFRRVRYVDEGFVTDEQLAEQLRETEQVLCVVNSRKQAQQLFSLLNEDGVYHLSTLLTPYDRKRILQMIRERLKNGKVCRVISTSLIEAGVDVDFPSVWRAIAGLDSIIQAGGRCNREEKRPQEESIVHIFRSEAKAPRMLEQNIAATERIMQRHKQIDSPEAIHDYFEFLLYTLKNEHQLDEKEIIRCINKLMFETVAKQFHMIDGADYTIYIPVDKGAELIRKLRSEGPSRELIRELGFYSVSVYHQYFEQMELSGRIEKISENAGILNDIGFYSQETGLPFMVSEQDQILIV